MLFTAQNGSHPKGLALLEPYVGLHCPVPAAMVIVFTRLSRKALARGQPIPHMTILDGLKGGLKAAPTVGVSLERRCLSSAFEKVLTERRARACHRCSKLCSCRTVSAPVLAVFNGQNYGMEHARIS